MLTYTCYIQPLIFPWFWLNKIIIIERANAPSISFILQLESDIKEAEKLVKLLRAQGLRDKDTLSHITASGKTIDLKPILQQSVKLLNSTKPGANVLATPLQTSQLHTPHHTPSSRPHHTSTTPQHRPHSARTTAPSITSVSMATPSSGCYAAYGSAIRSARSTTVTLHTKRHHTSHTSTSDTPHSFNLSTFSGSAGQRTDVYMSVY